MAVKHLLITLLILFSSFPVFSETFTLSSSEKDWLQKHPVIRIGVGTSYPPIQYVEETDGEAELRGIASDYVAVLSELLGVEFKVEFGITFTEAMEMAKRKELDMFPCVAYSEARDEFLDFTEGYLKNPIVIFANEDAPFIGSIEDLDSLRVADVESFYQYRRLKNDVPGIDFVLKKDAESCLQTVAFGEADANVAGLISGSYMIKKNNWANIKVAAPTPYPDTVFRMAVRDDWPELVSILDKTLASIEQPQRNDIERKWLSVRYEYGIDQGAVLKRLLLVAGIAVVVIGLTFLWVARLSKEIKRRKEVEKSLNEREVELRKTVDEKELLIREVYHRVKNNLTLVSSLVDLQASELSNPKDIEKMKLVLWKIDSIILLHEKLSMSHDLEKIDFSIYLEELFQSIEHTRAAANSGIEIKYQTENVFFNAKTIIPLGLIITELVTNSLKYGYPQATEGLIEISLKHSRENAFVLTVKNNGEPISEDLDFSHLKSLGLMLVNSLIEQLGGEMKITRAPSPEFRITFPDDIQK